MKFLIHSAILCSMVFYFTFVTCGFFVIKGGFRFGSKLFFFREIEFPIRSRRFLVRKFSKISKWFLMGFRFVMFIVRCRRTLTITIFGSRSFKRVIVELFTETA